MADIFQQCQLFDSVRDRLSKLLMIDEDRFEHMGQPAWEYLVLSELDWLGFLVGERVLPAKLVERSYGREALGLIETCRGRLEACTKGDPRAFENLRQWEKQLKAASVQPAKLGEASNA